MISPIYTGIKRSLYFVLLINTKKKMVGDSVRNCHTGNGQLVMTKYNGGLHCNTHPVSKVLLIMVGLS